MIDSGTIGSNDGPFLHALGITIYLEENVKKSLSNFKHLSTSSDNSIKSNFSSLEWILYLNLTQYVKNGLVTKVKKVTIYQSLNIHLFYYLLLQT